MRLIEATIYVRSGSQVIPLMGQVPTYLSISQRLVRAHSGVFGLSSSQLLSSAHLVEIASSVRHTLRFSDVTTCLSVSLCIHHWQRNLELFVLVVTTNLRQSSQIETSARGTTLTQKQPLLAPAASPSLLTEHPSTRVPKTPIHSLNHLLVPSAL